MSKTTRLSFHGWMHQAAVFRSYVLVLDGVPQRITNANREWIMSRWTREECLGLARLAIDRAKAVRDETRLPAPEEVRQWWLASRRRT